MTEGKRHHAVLRPGSPLWPIFEMLKARGAEGATSWEIEAAAAAAGRPQLNISTSAGDIRKCARGYGYEMLPATYEGKRGEGACARKVYRYRLVKIGGAQREPAPVFAHASASAAQAPASPPPGKPARSPDLFGRVW